MAYTRYSIYAVARKNGDVRTRQQSQQTVLEAGPSGATEGPGKPLSRGPITTSFCMRQNLGIEREETWGGVSLHRPTRGLGERRKLPSWGPGPKMDFMHILVQKDATWNTLFRIFERWRAPKRRWAWENFPLPLLDGPG